ncbi:unnamed protein product [Rhizophagus irregularis]|nr:unnamed protein product [Rhizophagus irregularis]
MQQKKDKKHFIVKHMTLVFLIIILIIQNDQKINKTSKTNSIFKASSKSLSKVFKTLKINSKNEIQKDYKKKQYNK